MTRAEVTVLIPTIGRRGMLEGCIDSVLSCELLPDDVLVVDQSEDAYVGDRVRERGDPVRRVPCDGRGTARAMNVGLAAARHDVVLVTHDDCTVAPDWITRALEHAKRSPDALVTGRVLAPDGSRYVPSTKDSADPEDYTGRLTSGVLFPANMVVDRRAIQEIGGFDERPSLIVAEDNDLCYRWLRDGRPLLYRPDMVVWHHDWRTPEELVRTHVAYARSQGGFYAKHLVERDWQVLRLLRWDLRRGLRSTARGLLTRQARWEDPYREMVGPLLLGLAAGLVESRRAARRHANR